MRSIERPLARCRPTRLAGALAAVACLLLAAARPQPAGAQPANGDWPRWATPEEAGFSSTQLATAEQLWWAIDDAPVAALFVVYKGRVLAAFGDETADHQCHSVRKSLLSALYGIHVANGTIDLEATVGELGIDDFPALTEDEKQARVRDLLMARSGIYHEAACETPEMRDARPPRGSHPPGTYWYYNNWDFNALGTIFRQETGRDIFAEFKQKIARRVGMQEFQATRCWYEYEPQYSQHPCYVFRMSARDRARFGQLFLQRGRWGRRQIVPESWVEESTRGYSDTEPFTGNPGLYYGYMWLNLTSEFFADQTEDPRLHHLSGFAASGYGGQMILVVPDAEMVVVTAVDVPAGGNLEPDEWGPVIETILTARDIVDLRLRRARIREAVAAAGDTVHLVARVRNRSPATTVPTTVEFFLTPAASPGDEIRWLGSAALPSLAANRQRAVRLAAPLPEDLEPGRYRLIASVDDDGTNFDLRRANNLKIGRRALRVR